MTQQLDDYILAHISPEPPHLAKLDRDTHLYRLYPHMCSGHLQGRVLAMLAAMCGARRVLEIGTYSGYATQCLAEGLPDDDCHVHTIEVDDEAEDFIRRHLDESPVKHRITLHMGDALALIPQLGEQYGPFDLVLIDANKRDYCRYYDLVLPLLPSGGIILADNTLWAGKVAQRGKRDAQTRGIEQFNRKIAADPRVSVVMLPVRDGLSVIRKK